VCSSDLNRSADADCTAPVLMVAGTCAIFPLPHSLQGGTDEIDDKLR